MQLLAIGTLAVHLLWILWVIFGGLWTHGRPSLTAFHVLSLIWGIVVELSPLPCPLTLAEQYFEQQAGGDAYRGAFLVHVLEKFVYPDISGSMLVVAGVAVCAFNLAIYAWRV